MFPGIADREPREIVYLPPSKFTINDIPANLRYLFPNLQ